MPILSSIHRKSKGGRLLIAFMYLLLIAGSVTMVYPFLLLLSGSVKSDVDITNFDILPEFFHNDLVLFRKFEAQRYNDRPGMFEKTTCNIQDAFDYKELQPPKLSPPVVMQEWYAFLEGHKSWPMQFLSLSHTSGNRSVSELTIEYKRRLTIEHPDVPKYLFFGEKSERSMESLKPEEWSLRTAQRVSGAFSGTYYKMREEIPLRYFRAESVRGTFLAFMKPQAKSEASLKKLNQKWGTDFKNINDIPFTDTPPSNPGMRKNWLKFIQDQLSSRFINFSPELHKKYVSFLKEKFKELPALNKAYNTNYTSWDIPFPTEKSSRTAVADLEGHFLLSLKDPEGITLDATDFRWRKFLKAKYGNDIVQLNQAHQKQYASFDEVPMPTLEYDWDILQKHRGEIKREMITRNYRIVWSYISTQAHAIRNTLLFCGLSILVSLIINPIAAYALSRFQPRWGYQVLFILMATMAFPHEVTQIPSFLLLRDFGLLNTFWALVIPHAANGYSIFLLKGFFDSLPKDLYESATLDGASEIRIFFTITMPLSAPILAVIALHAFTHAYGAFMFALLVCQDEKMWTIMVYVYQLQQIYNTPVVFAALVMAAIPTLLVFIFCQNIIMRGIVVPVEK